MAIIKRKTQKSIGKQLRKTVKKHGPEATLGAATALVTTIINKATDKAAKKAKGKTDKKGKKSAAGAAGAKSAKGTKGTKGTKGKKPAAEG